MEGNGGKIEDEWGNNGKEKIYMEIIEKSDWKWGWKCYGRGGNYS